VYRNRLSVRQFNKEFIENLAFAHSSFLLFFGLISARYHEDHWKPIVVVPLYAIVYLTITLRLYLLQMFNTYENLVGCIFLSDSSNVE
jgi:hypothetical protein